MLVSNVYKKILCSGFLFTGAFAYGCGDIISGLQNDINSGDYMKIINTYENLNDNCTPFELETEHEHIMWEDVKLAGDNLFIDKQYDKSVEAYKRAAAIRSDKSLTPSPPSTKKYIALIKKVEQAAALSDKYHNLDFLLETRNVSVEGISLPITFDFNSTNLTDSGTKVANDLANQILAENPGSIELSGHTDDTGSDEYNLNLSKERALKIAQFLKNKGYSGQISIKAMGESSPYPVEDKEFFTKDELDKINRRVQVK